MDLIQCIDCRKLVSPEANRCPHCKSQCPEGHMCKFCSKKRINSKEYEQGAYDICSNCFDEIKREMSGNFIYSCIACKIQKTADVQSSKWENNRKSYKIFEINDVNRCQNCGHYNWIFEHCLSCHEPVIIDKAIRSIDGEYPDKRYSYHHFCAKAKNITHYDPNQKDKKGFFKWLFNT